MTYDAETLRSALIMLVTADLAGTPLNRAQTLNLLTEHPEAFYTADLISSLVHTLASAFVTQQGSVDAALRGLQGAAIAPLLPVPEAHLTNQQEDHQ